MQEKRTFFWRRSFIGYRGTGYIFLFFQDYNIFWASCMSHTNILRSRIAVLDDNDLLSTTYSKLRRFYSDHSSCPCQGSHITTHFHKDKRNEYSTTVRLYVCLSTENFISSDRRHDHLAFGGIMIFSTNINVWLVITISFHQNFYISKYKALDFYAYVFHPMAPSRWCTSTISDFWIYFKDRRPTPLLGTAKECSSFLLKIPQIWTLHECFLFKS